MSAETWRKVRMFVITLIVLCALLVLGCRMFVSRALFYPTHDIHETTLTRWMRGGQQIGFAREVAEPRNVWLFLHGNGGQASHRTYALHAFADDDAVFVLEYPGYGQREGRPSRHAFDAAAREGYADLRARFPETPICILGESLGSGPASMLSREPPAPEKIVLVVPFDSITDVGRRYARFLPAGLILAGTWNNVEALRGYAGPVEIFGAERDEVIPVAHARALAKALPRADFHLIAGGHGWANARDVKFRCP